MSDELYAEKLAHFKDSEKPEVVLLVGDDLALTKIIVAWTSTTVARAGELSSLRGDSDSDAWNWLWENAVYSREELIAKSALPGHAFERKIVSLIGNRVLYPDGTINSFVERYLRERVLKLFEAKPTRRARRS